MTGVPKNLTRHEGRISREDRERLLGQRACAVWLTGLPSSGKSTIARALEERLFAGGNLAYVLDGDNFRQGLNSDLGFSPADRAENIRRLSEVAVLFLDAGVILIAAFISPFRAHREAARARVGPSRFLEIFIDTAPEVCESRDPKGLWARARRGEVPDFTGVSS
ncbi:MAG TPA: adenylyl-sulfate kinase, partial [Thermoanaerobaculia bacterium]|nr:adenylyl-sulfate kinase [Thermoanaerobaculia bacterium]